MNNKNVQVIFRIPRMWGNPEDVFMGAVTPGQARAFMKRIRENKHDGKTCIESFSAHYEETLVYSADAHNGAIQNRGRRLIISDTTLWSNGIAPCGADVSLYTTRVRNCARRIVAGLCTDTIGRTIGAMLYPKLYAIKNNEKAK